LLQLGEGPARDATTVLKQWHYQPERRGASASEESTIREQRCALARRLQKTLSLQTCITDPDWWDDA
jgi:hypothetical protein